MIIFSSCISYKNLSKLVYLSCAYSAMRLEHPPSPLRKGEVF